MAHPKGWRRETFEYRSHGENVVSDLYLPGNATGPVPVVVTGSGFAGVKEMLLPIFAERLAQAGIACLMPDFVGFGASGGQLRQDIKPFDQIQTMQDGLTALEKDTRFDKDRFGVWGPSLAGAHSLVIAATDARIKAVVAIIPHISVGSSVMDQVKLFLPISLDFVGRAFGRPPMTLKVNGMPGDTAVMTTDGAHEWMTEITKNAPNYKNEVTLASLLQMVRYNTALYAAKIKIPLLAITAIDDGITPASKIHAALKGNKYAEIKDYPGSHFGLFGEYLDEVVQLTTDFFIKHLNTTYTAKL